MRTSINESIIEYYTTTSLIIGSLEISKPLLFQALYQAFHCRRNYLLLLKKEHLETFHSFVIYGLTNILLTKKKKIKPKFPPSYLVPITGITYLVELVEVTGITYLVELVEVP